MMSTRGSLHKIRGHMDVKTWITSSVGFHTAQVNMEVTKQIMPAVGKNGTWTSHRAGTYKCHYSMSLCCPDIFVGTGAKQCTFCSGRVRFNPKYAETEMQNNHQLSPIQKSLNTAPFQKGSQKKLQVGSPLPMYPLYLSSSNMTLDSRLAWKREALKLLPGQPTHHLLPSLEGRELGLELGAVLEVELQAMPTPQHRG